MQFFDYFKDMRLKDGAIHVAYTGAVIKPDAAFRKSARAMLKIYLYFKLRQLARIFSKPKGTIAYYPQLPGPWYNIWQVSRLAQLKTITDINAADYVFIFEDKTVTAFKKSDVAGLSVPRVNQDMVSISKDYVSDVFERVFGYALGVDPTVYTGKAVQKSDDNGTHDGVEIMCPIPASAVVPGQAYQKLIDSTFDGKTSEDLRVAFAMGKIALVYHKHKPLDDRFGTFYLSVDVKPAEDAFSDEEIALITQFCAEMALDFGAIDVMRDKHDGRIYIVDVNKTCMPVLSLTLRQQIQCQQTIADTLMQGLTAAR